ncbi:AI-2E family transporter [Candidatus Neomarinimicrobiota bacterium]
MTNPRTPHPQLRIVVRFAQTLVPLAVVILLWNHISGVLLLLVISLLLASLLGPLVSIIESYLRGNRLGAVLSVYLALILLIVSSIRGLAPVLINEARSMATALQGQSVETLIQSTQDALLEIMPEALAPTIQENSANLVEKAGGQLSALMNGLAGIIGSVVGVVMNLIIVLVFTFILLLEARNFKVQFLRAVPNAYFEMALNLLEKIHQQVSGYIRGQGIAALSVGILSTLGLYLVAWLTEVNIPYAFIIGMVAGFANLIPFIGPFVGMIPAILAYLMTAQAAPITVSVPLIIVGMFLSVQMIDNFLISPKIVSSSVGIHPIMVIILIMIGGSLGGPLGMLFAIPTFGVLKVTSTEVVWGLRSYRMI